MLYVFEGFRVDPQRRLLFAAGRDTPVRLPPRVFDTLLYMVEHRGEVLSKRTLLKSVWEGLVVGENSLDQSVSLLRRSLGERPDEHRFIVTVPRRGYQFVASVVVQSPASARAATAGPTSDPEAHSLYTQALSLSLRPSAENVRGAIDMLQTALGRDARFARAASLLAVQYANCVGFDFPVSNALTAAENAARRALLLDPIDGTSHAAVAVVQAIRGDWLSSAAYFRAARALGTDAFSAGAESGYLTQSVGHISRALQDAHEMLRTAPTQPMGAQMLAVAYLCQGRNAEAQHYADAAVRLGQSRTVAPLPEIYALLALRSGEYSAAAQHLVGGLSPRLHAVGISSVVERVCAALGNAALRRGATAELNDLESRLEPHEFDQPMRKRLLLWRTMLGDVDAAYAFLERCLDHYEQRGTIGSAWSFVWLPEMRPFRRDPRFQRFIARLHLGHYWREYGPPDECEPRAATWVCA